MGNTVCLLLPRLFVPYWDPGKRGKDGMAAVEVGWIHTRMESAVVILAHEFRHIMQLNYLVRYRGWDELDAERYAVRMLRQYRKTRNAR